jgi:phosphate acetyltransferase
VPRTLDIASVIDGEWVHLGEAKQRRILHSSLIASSIEYELNKFVAGELIISASERTDVLASSLATSNGIPGRSGADRTHSASHPNSGFLPTRD